MTTTNELSFRSSSMHIQKSIMQFQKVAEKTANVSSNNIEDALFDLQQANIQTHAVMKSESIIEKTKGSILDIFT
jgi:hypothetical protein